ncbi:DNA topoisomerase-1 [Rhizobium soli]|uniref:DNA topoisomerase n=1 Tax=Rhizobium soli TaxID=424798 RepID=A0A7X0JPJ5_9HYPH|nr:DNA topoisomerase IB [Rhizobium soli]MBB6510487.1 DNA topoisomerase-1 [Rhizobium soli]
MADEFTENIVDARDAAESVGLVYIGSQDAGMTRRKSVKGWSYKDPSGAKVRDKAVIDRINKIGIPPAYTDVWICPDERGHIQATGRDAKGRKQYRYHERFREVRDSTKYEHMLSFVDVLPSIRERVDADMQQRGLRREKIIATVVYLLETTMIRVGNADYAKHNKSYGLTTLNDRHVKVEGNELRFRFKGKSGKQWNLKLADRRVAKIVKQSQDLSGQHLFQYVDDEGEQREVSSGDVNTYLREISGSDITAKDFRTWTGTVLAALALTEFEKFDSEAAAKKNVRAAIEKVAARLGNTPAVCRRCYVHPEVIDSYMSETLVLQIEHEVERELRSSVAGLRPEEALVLAFLKQRLSEKLTT